MARGGGRPKGSTTKTAEERRLEGGTSGRSAVSHRPLPNTVVLGPRLSPEARPECPADLPAEGREIWEEAVEWLIDRNAAQIVDLPAIRAMCMHYAIARQATDVLATQGYFARGSTGQMVEHPAMRIMERNSSLFLRYATEFGLTTLGRTRIALLDVAGRSMESDLANSLGRNPRHTNRAAIEATSSA